MFTRTIALGSLLLAATAVAQPAAAPAPAASPAKLAVATRIAGKLLPNGTYRRMMDAMMGQVTSQVTNQMLSMPMRDLVGMSGLASADLEKMGPGTMRQVMTLLDPAFEERMRRTMPILTSGMTDIITRMEPSIRDGLAQAYASQFSDAELAEIDRFFASPTGANFAAKSMTIMTDPAIMAKMQALMPELMKAMPAIMQRAQAATADLPKPKRVADLSEADRAKLTALLGTDPAKPAPPAPGK